jgi:hypothetical protein
MGEGAGVQLRLKGRCQGSRVYLGKGISGEDYGVTRRGRCASGGRGEGDDQRGRAVGEGRSRWRAGRTGGGERSSAAAR